MRLYVEIWKGNDRMHQQVKSEVAELERRLSYHCSLGVPLIAFQLPFRDKKAIPPGIAPSTQVLDLRGNNIRVLHNNVFLQLGITNLQRIYCPYCGIVEIEARAFYRLTNLVELDLSENAMREVPSEAWKHTKALMRLNLSGNPIKLIR